MARIRTCFLTRGAPLAGPRAPKKAIRSTGRVRGNAQERPGAENAEEKDVGTRGWSLGASRNQEAKEDAAASTKGGLAALLVLAAIGAGTFLSARAMRNHAQRNAMHAAPASMEASTAEVERHVTKHEEPKLPSVDSWRNEEDESTQGREDVKETNGMALRGEEEEEEEEEHGGGRSVPEVQETSVEVEVNLSEAQVVFARTLETAAGANAAAAEAARTAGEAASASVEAARVATKLHVAITEGAETAIEDAILVAERAAKRAEAAESRAYAAAESAKKAAEEARTQANAGRGTKVTTSQPAKLEKTSEGEPWIQRTGRSWAENLKSSTQQVGKKAGEAAQATKNRIWLLMPSSKEEK